MKFIIPKEYKHTKIAKFVGERNHKITLNECLDHLFDEMEDKKESLNHELELVNSELNACKWFINTLKHFDLHKK